MKRRLACMLGLAMLSYGPPAVAGEPTVTPGENVYLGSLHQEVTGAGSAASAASGGESGGKVRITAPVKCSQGNCALNPNLQCDDEDEQYVVVYVLDPTTGEWRLYRQGCFSQVELTRLQITPDLVRDALRDVGLPTLSVNTNPADKTLVNLATVFFARPSTVTKTLNLLGQAVLVEATPTVFVWHFGDGETVTTDSPGAPYPAMDVTHRYAHAEVTMHPSVDTTYTARFRVNGGAWQDVDGTVTIAGPPIDLRVAEATPVLSGNR